MHPETQPSLNSPSATQTEFIPFEQAALSARRPIASERLCAPDGPEDAQILVLTDRPGWLDLQDGRLLTDHAGKTFWDAMRAGAGLLRSRVRVEAICLAQTPGRDWFSLSREERARWEFDALERLSALKPNLIMALGDWPLKLLTGQESADKWHMSVLPGLRPGSPKVLSVLHPERVFREHKSFFYLKLAAQRARQEALTPDIRRPHRALTVRPTLLEALAYLKRAERSNWLSVDIETCAGQITCVGFATSPHEALSVPTLPRDWSEEHLHELWLAIAAALAGPSKKVLQNGIYDLSYFSRYGVAVRNFHHDTMLAQRLLYPEFASGLDNIARIFTDEPYWKDDAKDWSARFDPDALYRYNAKDAVITLSCAWAQRVELERRGLSKLFYGYVMSLASGPVLEMSWRGLRVDLEERGRLAADRETKLAELERVLNEESERVLKRPTNPRSPKQVKELLVASGFKRLPLKDGKESSDKTALMKLRLKRPESRLLTTLIEASEVQKELSSYLRFELDEDSRVRYTLYALGTETQRMSCSKDPWGRGLNAQTTPHDLDAMFPAAEGCTFVEVDLAQADARVVAWDAPDELLMRFFHDGTDIHRYVASQPELFDCAPESVTHEQRQLGKKVGHAANYGVSAPTLVESCLKEMNLVLSESRAQQMLQGYMRTFPGVRRRQERIRAEISRNRALSTPTGFSRTFYDRFGPDLFREAYAFLPQHLVAFTINQLILWLYRARPEGVRLLLQKHDSLLLEVQSVGLDGALKAIQDQGSWNPTYTLAGGALRIPIEVKVGGRLSELKGVYKG